MLVNYCGCKASHYCDHVSYYNPSPSFSVMIDSYSFWGINTNNINNNYRRQGLLKVKDCFGNKGRYCPRSTKQKQSYCRVDDELAHANARIFFRKCTCGVTCLVWLCNARIKYTRIFLRWIYSFIIYYLVLLSPPSLAIPAYCKYVGLGPKYSLYIKCHHWQWGRLAARLIKRCAQFNVCPQQLLLKKRP